jgi:hypothetical protein
MAMNGPGFPGKTDKVKVTCELAGSEKLVLLPVVAALAVAVTALVVPML